MSAVATPPPPSFYTYIHISGFPLFLKIMNYMCTEGTEPFLYSTLNQIHVHVILIDRSINIIDVRQNRNRCL